MICNASDPFFADTIKNMISIAIVEDEKKFSDVISEYLRRYMEEEHVDFSFDVFQDGLAFLEDGKKDYDIVFMDIVMPHVDGMETARRLRKRGDSSLLVFITTMASYAIQGYEVEATDFLVKPVQYDLFRIKMRKLLSHLANKVPDYFCVKTATGVTKIPLAQVLYVDSQKHYLYFHMADGKEIRMRESMRNIIDALTKEGFAMASTTLLIHLSHVDSFQENCVLMGKRSFYIGRKYRKEFFHALSTYLSEGRG